MKNVLHIEVSPRKERSASIQVAHAFLDALKGGIPDLRVDLMDLWSLELPEFNGATLQAKYAGLEGRVRTAAEQKAWDAINALADRFKAADLVLLSVPMWNFTVPYKLKHLIDVVSQKDVLFTFDERGINGLLTTQRAVCILARGADFSVNGLPVEWDHQRPYLQTWLQSIGITAIDTVIAQKTLMGAEVDRQSRDAACEEARRLARSLAKAA